MVDLFGLAGVVVVVAVAVVNKISSGKMPVVESTIRLRCLHTDRCVCMLCEQRQITDKTTKAETRCDTPTNTYGVLLSSCECV